MGLLHRDVAHQNVIVSIAFSPDGSRILSGSWDGTAKLWDVDSGRLLRTLSWNSQQIDAVAWSPNKDLLAIAGSSPMPRLRNEDLETYQAHFGRRETISFLDSLPDDGQGPQVRLFDATNGAVLRIIAHAANGVAFSPDGQALAVLTARSISIFDLRDGRCLARFTHEDLHFLNVQFSFDGSLLAILASNGVFVFDARTAQLLRVAEDLHLFRREKPIAHDAIVVRLDDMQEHVEPQEQSTYVARFWRELLPEFQPTCSDHGEDGIAFSPDGRRAAVVNLRAPVGAGGVSVVDMQSLKVEQVLALPDMLWLRTVAFSPDGRYLAAAGDRQTIFLWDVETGQEIKRIGNPPPAIRSLAVNPVKPLLAAGADDGSVCLVDWQRRSFVRVHAPFETAIVHVEFSAGDVLVIGSRNGQVRVASIPDLETITEFQAHAAQLTGGTISKDGKRLITVGYSEEPLRRNTTWRAHIAAWSMTDGKLLEQLELPGQFRVTSVSASPDRQYLAILGPHELLVAGIANDIDLHSRFGSEKSWMAEVAFAGVNDVVLLGSDGFGMTVVDLKQKMTTQRIQATRDGPTSFAFTSSGMSIARSSAYSNEIEIFEFATGKLKKHFVGHQHAVWALAFSPDDQLLFSGGMDGTLKIWNVESGELLASVVSLPDSNCPEQKWQCVNVDAQEAT